jgi:hypothetical protein
MADVMATEAELVEMLKVLVDNYESSIDQATDLVYYAEKIEELLITGVEKIRV